jgi:transcriptional regulator
MSDERKTGSPINNTQKSYKNTGNVLFVPEHFEFSEQREMLNYIKDNPLANCVTYREGQMHSSCLPLFVDDSVSDEVCIVGHLARRNVQAQALRDQQEILALFTSPSAYIPSRWYEDIQTAPTWSYVSVQLRGTLELVTDVDPMMGIIQRCINTLEADTQPPWTPENIPSDRLERLQQGIIAFKIRNVELEGICRLNQDRTENDQRNIVRELAGRDSIGSQFIRNEMLSRLVSATDNR